MIHLIHFNKKPRKCEYDYEAIGTENYNWAWLCAFHLTSIKAHEELARQKHSV